MSWKNLFIANNEDGSEETKPVVPEKKIVKGQISDTKASAPVPNKPAKTQTPSRTNWREEAEQEEEETKPTNDNNPHVEELFKVYQEGFDKMNKDGIDFYEYYNSILPNKDNIAAYQMAFTMMKSLDKTISKEKLIDDAKYYIEKLNKGYEQGKANGQAKVTSLTKEKENEESNLKNEVERLTNELARIQQELSDKETQLSQIGDVYEEKFNEAYLRLDANDIVRDKFIGSIEEVMNNITEGIN